MRARIFVHLLTDAAQGPRTQVTDKYFIYNVQNECEEDCEEKK